MDSVKDSFKVFLQKSKEISGPVHEISLLVEKAVEQHWQIVDLASRVKKPTTEGLKSLVEPLGEVIKSIDEFKQKHRDDSLINHLAAISCSMPAVGWLTISPLPAPFVKEMMDTSLYYTNKILVASKEKGEKLHAEWVQSWLGFLQALHKWIRQDHTTGLVWNNQGGDAPAGPPAQPNLPPPPPMVGLGNLNQGNLNQDSKAALLRQLNVGTDITKNLRKVDRKLTTPTSDRSSRSKSPDPRSTTPAINRVPKFEFDGGRKWLVEHQDGNNGQEQFTIQATNMNQSVNIYNCKNIMVICQGKINSITVDSCKKLSLVFDDIVSLVEFINCTSIQAQPMAKVPTITIDKTDGIQLFLGKNSLDVEIVSAKASELNVCLVDGETFKEYPLPEQLKTTWGANGQFNTIALEKA